MGTISTIGLDLAKNVFQVHGIDSLGNILVRRRLRRDEVLRFFETLPPCLIGMEACGTSHYRARSIAAFGHTVRMMPPVYVKPYVKQGKTDAADAEAICEAVTRPTMRFVPVRSPAQQAALLQHKTRDLLVRQRTMQVNALRGAPCRVRYYIGSWRRGSEPDDYSAACGAGNVARARSETVSGNCRASAGS